jgi:chemotaxis response regulator CheB
VPSKNGMAFVIVQHLDPHHGSQLSKLLAKNIELAETVRP